MPDDRVARGLASQLLASLRMLKDCIDRCPPGEWNESRGDRPFSQVAFHALFDCDHGLSRDEGEFKDQPFHTANRSGFGEYEELEDRTPPLLPEPEFIHRYHEHCVAKVEATLRARSLEDLVAPDSDVYGTMTGLERCVNLARHVQHHAAQLGLRLQLSTGKEMEWVSGSRKAWP